MKRILLTVSAFSILTFGCAHTMEPASTPKEPPKTAAKKVDQQKKPAANLRQAGDFIVYEFSGDYRAQPLMLTQRVVERDGSMLVLDVSLQEGTQTQQFRLHVEDPANEIHSVARLVNGEEQPIDIAAYEEIMAETMLPIEANEAVVDRSIASVQIGSMKLPCKQTTYRVSAAGKSATMTILENPGFAWGDLGGEVHSSKGSLLYKATVVELGGPSSTQNVAVATQYEPEMIDAWDLEE